jgi:lysozyme
MKKRALFSIGLFVLMGLAAGAVALASWAPWRAHLVLGVDVSRHQGPIDWSALATTDVRFAYIKATEGADFVDERFADNWKGAGEAGLYRGGYHYFTLCKPGAAQAANFIAVVPRAAGALPPAIDLEHMGPCRNGPQIADVNAEVRAMLDALEARYGARPILYVTRQFHDAHLSAFSGEHFWVRSLAARPDFRQRDWIIWQRDNGARRAGVAGPVDLDAFRGDEAALKRLAEQ